MSVITNISVQQKHKDKVNIFIDDEFFMGISIELVYKFSLKKGMEVDSAFINEIVLENEKSEALSKGISYSSRNLKTEKQVKDYLFNKGYQPTTVYYVLDKLKEYKLIDDIVYAKRYIEINSNRQGEKMSRYKLRTKGVKADFIDSACEDLDIDYVSSAIYTAEKYLKNKPRTKDSLAKAYRYLIGKGYSYEQSSQAISKFKVDE